MTALLALLLSLASPPQAQARPASPPPEQVAGTVLRAGPGESGGPPIPLATVTLTDTTSEETAATTTADDQGNFRFAPVPSGKYRLTASAPGFLSSAYLAHDQYSTAIVTGAGLPTGHLLLRLQPEATLAGHVTEDSGDPVPSAQLTLYPEDHTSPNHVGEPQEVTADDGGAFEFRNLQPGTYFLVANGTPWYSVRGFSRRGGNDQSATSEPAFKPALDPAVQVSYPPSFFPDASTSETAGALLLHPGDRLTADLHLHPSPSIRLTLRLPPGTDPATVDVDVTTRIFGNTIDLSPALDALPQGNTLVLTGLPPGRYDLNLTGPAPISLGTLDLTGAPATLDVARPAATSSAVLTLRPLHGDTLPEQTSVSLRPASGPTLESTRGDDSSPGTFPFSNLLPGDYTPIVTTQGNRLTVTALTVNGKPVPGPLLHVAAAPLRATLTLSAASISIEGTASRAGRPAPASMILLVPATATPDPELFRRDQSDLDGSFTLPSVPPGRYILVAIDDGWLLRWSDPATLAPFLLHGLPLTIPADSSATLHLTQPLPTQPRPLP